MSPLIDSGGARAEHYDLPDPQRPWTRPPKKATDPEPAPARWSVRVAVSETHDGEPCDCITKDLDLGIGDELVLTHVCHDGRVDKVVGRIVAISAPPPEHGTATVRPPS